MGGGDADEEGAARQALGTVAQAHVAAEPAMEIRDAGAGHTVEHRTGNIVTNTEYLEGMQRTSVYTYSPSVPNEQLQEQSESLAEYISTQRRRFQRRSVV